MKSTSVTKVATIKNTSTPVKGAAPTTYRLKVKFPLSFVVSYLKVHKFGDALNI